MVSCAKIASARCQRRFPRDRAIVTGGAKGIGKVYSHALAAEGATVIVTHIEGSAVVVDALRKDYGPSCAYAFQFEVSIEKDVAHFVGSAMECCAKIDVLVNNSALFSTLKTTEPWEIDVELWDRVMAVNVRGPFLMVKHVAPHMIKAGYGKIINIGSGTAYRPSDTWRTMYRRKAQCLASPERSPAISANRAFGSTRWRLV